MTRRREALLLTGRALLFLQLCAVPHLAASAGPTPSPAPSSPAVAPTKATPSGPSRRQRLEYLFPAGRIVVHDLDDNFRHVKTVRVPTGTVLGAVAHAATASLYLSYGNYTSSGKMLKYDLRSDRVLWTRSYAPLGADSMAITPDGKTIYMPAGEGHKSGIWQVLDAATGESRGSIETSGKGPHNTSVSLDGSRVYLGPRGSDYLLVADTATNTVIREVGPVPNDVRPFSINARGTLAYITSTRFIGFVVADLVTGSVLYKLPVEGYPLPWRYHGPSAPSHGISLSPDEKEVYVIDIPHSAVHVFEVGGVPAKAPIQAATIPVKAFQGWGWIEHSRDGRLALVGTSGDVIDTRTRRVIAHLPALAQAKVYVEIHFRDGVPVWAPLSRSQGGYPD